jgi:hypothetical protein
LVALAGVRPEQIFILAIAAMILVVAAVRLVRYLLKRREVANSASSE